MAAATEVATVIRVDNVSFAYQAKGPHPVPALVDVSLEVQEGEFVVIVGHNGSGKSTLAKHLNALLIPTRGDVWVDGINTRDRSRIWEIRERVGMTFQNPDNQLVATLVEDDVAFGTENLGVPPAEIQARVDEAMALMGITSLREKAPHMLSGGQKQRVAIAGVLAMRSRYIVMDEPTSLLAPLAREEVMEAIRVLRREGIAVVLVTHFMHEAVEADRVVVMEGGRIIMTGPPREVFARVDELRALSLDVPLVTQLAVELHRLGLPVPGEVLTVEELMAHLC
ncbi:MAG: energy-coupling factor transporter ATPase [Bacillota bacterium]